MYEMIFYIGIVLAISFFMLAVFLYFKNNIPIVIQYFLRMSNKKLPKSTVKADKYIDKKEKVVNEQTELLDVAQNYATALLDADNTEILPYIDENGEY